MVFVLMHCHASTCSHCKARLFFAARTFSRSASSAVSKRTRSHAHASVVQAGGITLSREDVVKEDDPTNNVPDFKFPEKYQKFDDLSPIVSVISNFDDVLVPPDHVSRRCNDTYYISSDTVLRTHTSAHQAQKLREGCTHFLVTGDVYRRDSIDATHYPMEGFPIFSSAEWEAAGTDGTSFALQDLKDTLEGLAKRLFGDVETRWVDTYFPFTNPSLELEIFFQIVQSG
ncbi:hypothetical protein L7F22_026826 [Adiantum nelumboides]|nr:hypothetical protein [Adiantum nelumboides]